MAQGSVDDAAKAGDGWGLGGGRHYMDMCMYMCMCMYMHM